MRKHWRARSAASSSTALEHLSVAQRANSRNYKAVEVEDPAPTRLKQGIRQERKLEQGRGIRW
jgi:hypothetical protein